MPRNRGSSMIVAALVRANLLLALGFSLVAIAAD
jgi:hypothetical protein